MIKENGYTAFWSEMTKEAHDVRCKMNALGAKSEAFVFLIDFEIKEPHIFPISELPISNIAYDLNGYQFGKTAPIFDPDFDLIKNPISKASYQKGFDYVLQQIKKGNSFLTNYTRRTEVKTPHTLEEIYSMSKAPYKFLWRNRFMCFSPETFVRIKAGIIKSFPMKGTIDAQIPDAKKIILADKKETAEHITIVDLIRNDLSRVAKKITVDRFRYLDHINTSKGGLIQVSSEISGELPPDYKEHLGDILFTLLPAGSVSGAPKKKTLEIIKTAEQEDRGFYTGVVGYFDGENVDSAVMIRFLEQNEDGLTFQSGGGITSNSSCDLEYQEMIKKVYIPIL